MGVDTKLTQIFRAEVFNWRSCRWNCRRQQIEVVSVWNGWPSRTSDEGEVNGGLTADWLVCPWGAVRWWLHREVSLPRSEQMDFKWPAKMSAMTIAEELASCVFCMTDLVGCAKGTDDARKMFMLKIWKLLLYHHSIPPAKPPYSLATVFKYT